MKNFTLFLLISLLSISHLKAQTQASRVIAYTTYQSGVGTDSAHFYYTGGNGGDFNTTIKFSTQKDYKLNVLHHTYDSAYLYLQTFNGDNDIATTTTQIFSGGNWVNNFKQLFSYDADKNDTAEIDQTWDKTNTQWVNYIKYSTAISNNKKISVLTWNWDTQNSKWIKSNQALYSYIGDNNSLLLNQNYNTADNTWLDMQKDTNTYDANNNLQVKLQRTWDNVHLTWYNTIRYTHFYDANNMDTLQLEEAYNGAAWAVAYKYIRRHNSFNQLTMDSATSGAPKPVLLQRFYYETYTPSAVQNLEAGADNILLYPNPAADMMQISVNLKQEQPVQLSLFNILGAQVWGADMGRAMRVEATLPVNNLPTGTYILRVNTGGTLQQKELIISR